MSDFKTHRKPKKLNPNLTLNKIKVHLMLKISAQKKFLKTDLRLKPIVIQKYLLQKTKPNLKLKFLFFLFL